MDCPTWPTWLAVASNLVLWALIGYWYAAIRRLRRLEGALIADRALVAANLARSESLLAGLDQFAPWVDRPDPPVH